jgi:hypothetical protein
MGGFSAWHGRRLGGSVRCRARSRAYRGHTAGGGEARIAARRPSPVTRNRRQNQRVRRVTQAVCCGLGEQRQNKLGVEPEAGESWALGWQRAETQERIEALDGQFALPAQTMEGAHPLGRELVRRQAGQQQHKASASSERARVGGATTLLGIPGLRPTACTHLDLSSRFKALENTCANVRMGPPSSTQGIEVAQLVR